MSSNNILQSRPSEVSVLYAEEEHLTTQFGSGPWVRSVYIIECCTGGSGTLEINGKLFPIRPGDCYALLPGCTVTFCREPGTPRSGFWCALEGFSVKNVLEKAGITPKNPFLPPSLFPSVKFWLQQLAQQWSQKDAGARLRQTGCAYGLLGALLENRPAQDNSGIIEKIIGYMQAYYRDELSLDTLAKQAGLERTYFSFLFKQKVGQSPHNYLTQIRIHKACQLLSARCHTITEVADMVGLSPHNFSRQFRQVMGITAKEYRQMLVNGSVTTGLPPKD